VLAEPAVAVLRLLAGREPAGAVAGLHAAAAAAAVAEAGPEEEEGDEEDDNDGGQNPTAPVVPAAGAGVAPAVAIVRSGGTVTVAVSIFIISHGRTDR
jgi:hypothetical protein